MAVNKPSNLSSKMWASAGTVEIPSDAKIASGWTLEVPKFQNENWIQARQDQAIGHINERGIVEWDATTNYIAGKSYVQGGNGKVYLAKVNSGPSSSAQNPTTDLEGSRWVEAFADKSVVASEIARLDALSEHTARKGAEGRQDIGVRAADGSADVQVKTGIEADLALYGYGVGPVYHGYHANGSESAPTRSLSGQLGLGIGSRPWTGTKYTEHSTAALHFYNREDVTDSAQGSGFKLLVTPVGGTQEDRVEVFKAECDAPGQGARIRMKLAGGNLQERVYFQGLPEVGADTSLALLPAAEGGAAQFSVFASPNVVNSRYSQLRVSDSENAASIVLGDLAGPGNPLGFRIAIAETGVANKEILTCIPSENWALVGTRGFTANLGTPESKWGVLYAATGTINTSDAREKTPVRGLTEKEIAAAKALSREIGAYKWLSSIAEKGEDKARSHVGMTVQRAVEVMAEHDLQPFDYGFICHDEWDETPEKQDADGNVFQAYRPAGERYSFRMDELMAFVARGMVAAIDNLEERLAKVEAGAAG